LVSNNLMLLMRVGLALILPKQVAGVDLGGYALQAFGKAIGDDHKACPGVGVLLVQRGAQVQGFVGQVT